MKELTDFFGSPSRTYKDANSDFRPDNDCMKTDKNELKMQNNDDSKTARNSRKKRKKKSKRKPSDPAVKNIVDLLSNSLCIISPNTSLKQTEPENQCSKQISDKNVDENKVPNNSDAICILGDESNSLIVSKDETSQSSTSNIEVTKTKLNAFQFMMESRNRSIGMNSPGKDVPEESKMDEETGRKDVLAARKNLLQNWANRSGGAKRKREEEEKDEVINQKLQKRARRLRKLLKVDQISDIDNDSSDVRIKRKRSIKRISSSSSENSKDSVVLVQDCNRTCNPILEVIEENAQDKILNNSKPKGTKQGLLTFFGVVNKSEKIEVCQEETVQSKKIKELNNSKLKKEELKSSKTNITEDNSNDSSVKKKKFKSKKHKKHTDESSQESLSKMPKTTKNGLKNDDEGIFTPRSSKSWKLKIKINEATIEKKPEQEKTEKRPQRSKRIRDYKQLLGDVETSNEGETLTQKKRSGKVEMDDVIICSDEELEKKKELSKPLKVAPVFTKVTPKPKVAPEVVQARKQFLMSGIPESLKKNIEKQQSIEEREYDIFPSISHVQQKCNELFWNLPAPQLELKDNSPLKSQKPVACIGLTTSQINSTLNIQKEVEKVDKLKTLVNKIKSDNPNYPVYKSFRLIFEKSGKNLALKEEVPPKSKKRRKGQSKKLDESVEIIEDIKIQTDPIEHAMWTYKYKPKCSEDIIGNFEGVKKLKKWLELWKSFTEGINTSKKKKRGAYCSDSDFESTDCDSRDSTKLPGSTVVVEGPYGTGKSTAIYAICNELGFNVIELNASSKRTGKRLLQELQEATQSHQVRKKGKNMQNFFQTNETKEQMDKKMCVLLIEDVDVVFEQDEGFISALSQLVSISKRPIVLTTTDTSPVFVQKFISQYEYISFLPLSSQSLATWLQIVCLVEGLLVNQSDIGALLEYNGGDVRKTLLQLQFWVQSGGQIVRDDLLVVKTSTKFITMEQKLVDDEQEPLLEEDNKETQEFFVHSDCIKSFEIFKHHKSYRVPYNLNLGLLWWNIPNILGIRSFSEERIRKFKDNRFEINNGEDEATAAPQVKKLIPIERRKLDSIAKLYDSLAFTDVSFKAVGYFDNFEPGVKNFNSTIKDSLELEESLAEFDDGKDFIHEVTHNLVNGYVDEFNCIENGESILNIAMPEKAERRWRAKMHVCEDVFLEALPLSTYIERRSIALDYMPYLRNISRSENRRAAKSTKRGNRFRNYLRDLGINYNDNTLKLSCNILIDEL